MLFRFWPCALFNKEIRSGLSLQFVVESIATARKSHVTHLAESCRQHAARQVPQADMALVRAQRQQAQPALGARHDLVGVLWGTG